MEEITITSEDFSDIVYERRAQYYETDQMGIVHHSNYIRWFEEARCYYLDKIGLAYKEIENQGIMIPVLGVNCEYKYSVAYDEAVEIRPDITSFNGVKMTISYEVTGKENGQLKCKGTTQHCFVNQEFKPVSLKKSYKDMYDLFNLYLKPEV